MLSEIDNAHHRPYEVLLLGHTTDVQMPPVTENKAEGEGEEEMRKFPSSTSEVSELGSPPPNGYVIMSVPGEHSRKPPLARILLTRSAFPVSLSLSLSLHSKNYPGKKNKNKKN